MDVTTVPSALVEPGAVRLRDRIMTPAGDEASVWTRETGRSTWIMLGVRLRNGKSEWWSYAPHDRVELVACALTGRAA